MADQDDPFAGFSFPGQVAPKTASKEGVAPPQSGASDDPFSGFSFDGKSGAKTAPAAAPAKEVDVSNMPWSQYIGGALGNVPSDVGAAAENIIEPFKHPTETMQALGSVGTGLYSKAAGALGVTQDAKQKAKDEAAIDAIGKHFSDQYGSKDAFMKSFYQRPVQTLMDISAPFTLGETALARAPGIIGDIGVAAGKVGAVTDPINIALKTGEAASKGLTTATALPLWMKSGASMEALQQAAKAGRTSDPAFWEHFMGGTQPEVLADKVQDAISQAAQKRSEAYKASMADQSKLTDPLSYNLIDKAVGDARASNTTVGGFPIKQGTNDALQKVEAVINQYKNQPNVLGAHSITDMDALKKSLDEIRATYPPGSPEAAIVTQARKAVYDTIAAKDSGYAKIMQEYGDASDQLRNFRGIAGKTNAPTATTVKKLIQAQNKGYTKNLLDQLAEIDPSIPARIAGTELHELMPIGLRGYLGSLTTQMGLSSALGSVFHPVALAHLAASSPRVAGGLQYTMGTLTGRPLTYAQKAAEVVPGSVRYPLYETGKLEQQQNPNQRYIGGRVGRATGGRTGGVTTADMLIAAAERAKKNNGKATEALLHQPDEVITHALAIANKRN